MQAQPAAARLPLRPMRVIPESLDQRPRLAGIARHEQRRRLDAAIERVGLALAAGHDLPDLLAAPRPCSSGNFTFAASGFVHVLPKSSLHRSSPPQCMLLRPGPDPLCGRARRS